MRRSRPFRSKHKHRMMVKRIMEEEGKIKVNKAYDQRVGIKDIIPIITLLFKRLLKKLRIRKNHR